MDFSLAHFHGRVYAFAGRKADDPEPPENFHLDTVVLREDLGGWDAVPDLVFTSHFSQYAVIPYNL